MIKLGDAPQPPSDEELLGILREPVSKLLKDDIPPDVEPERVWALRQAQKADFYWRALQHLGPTFNDSGQIQYSAIGAPISNANSDSNQADDYVINIFRGYGRKFIAVLGARLPNVKAVPDDPNDEEMVKVAANADIAAIILRAKWDMEMRHMELALRLYKDSTCFLYTPWVTDGEKYGKRTEPKIEVRSVPQGPEMWRCQGCGMQSPEPIEQCAQCGSDLIQHEESPSIDVPEQVGVSEYENGSAEFHICNIFTVTVPFHCKDLDDAPYLKYEYDEWKGRLIHMFPELRDQKNNPYSAGISDSAADQLAKQVRDAAASPIGIPNPNNDSRWSYTRIWLKTTAMYELVDEKSHRKLLFDHFPDGLKITLVNGRIMKLENEKLTDVWASCKPEASEYIYADGIGYDMMPVQDLKNDVLNLSYRTFEGGLGLNFADPRCIDVQYWNGRQRRPNEIIPVLPEYGGQLSDAFHSTQPAQLNPQIYEWMASLEADGRVAIGTTEAVYGGQIQGDSTAHEAELRKNAALQQLGLTYIFIRKADEKVYTNGVKQLAKYGTGTLQHSKRNESGKVDNYTLDLSQLQETGWHFESEEAFPMTHAERRAYLMFILGNQITAQGLGVTHPRNIVKNQELLGLSDYYADGVDDHEKAQDVIAELLKSAPIQKPMPDGTMQIVPSIPIDDFDNHALMGQEAYAWCKGQSGRKQQKSNPMGFANVVAWGLAHMKAGEPPKPPLPPAKLAISAKMSDLGPEAAAQILGDYGVDVDPLAIQPPPPPESSEDGPPKGDSKMKPPSDPTQEPKQDGLPKLPRVGVQQPPQGPPPPGAPPLQPGIQ